MKFWKSALAVGALLAASQAAQAATVSCPGTLLNVLDREFKLTTANAATCVAYGTGNFENAANGEATYLAAGWTIIDKTDDNGGVLNGALTVHYDADDNGTFNIAQAVWNMFSEVLFVMKSGQGIYDPDWAVFRLAANTLSGSWDIDTLLGIANGLSHVNIYGRGNGGGGPGPTPVSEPATLALFALGLAGLALRRRRRVEA